MGTGFFFLGFGLGGANQPPVAQVVPADQLVVMGSIVRLDGRNSYDPEGQPLTYSWSFLDTPTGSELTDASFEDLDGDSSVVGFTPDVTGYYEIQLVVNDGALDSEPATARTRVDAALAPTCTDIVPDARFIFRTISDFWSRFFEQKDMLPIVWSAYIQSFGAELLRLYEANNNKSIAHIQDLVQRRWLTYDPRVVLDPTLHYVVQGNEQEGLDARTGPFDTTVRALVVSAQELRVVSGAVRPSAAGKEIEVLTSNGVPGNTGAYTVSRVSKNLSGYTLSKATPLPLPSADIIAFGTDLTFNEGFDIVRSPTHNFAALSGFEQGDYLQVTEGSARGFYEILGIGLADGLPDDNSLRLDRNVHVTGTAAFRVHNVVEVRTPAETGAFTDVVYVPAATCEFDALTSPPITGRGTLRGPREIVLGADRVFEAAVGLSIQVLGGQNAGIYVIGDVNDSRDGYVIAAAFTGPYPQANVPYRVEAVGTAVGRVITVGGEAYTLLRAYEDETYPDPPTGPGPVGIGIADSGALPSRLDSQPWRVAATLVSEETDFSELGVTAGDLVIGKITRLDTNAFATVYGTVVGADRNRLGFEFTRSSFDEGAPGDISDAEVVDLCEQLDIPGAALDVFGNLLLTGQAEQLRDTVNSVAFNRQYGNLPLRDTTDIDVGPFAVRVEAAAVVRNHQILVHDDVVSVPCLREYIRPPVVRDTGDELLLVTRDDANVPIEQIPVTLMENRDYIIDSDGEFLGRDGEFVVATESLLSVSGDFIKRRVRPGDTVTVEYGDNAGTHVVLAVRSATELQVRRKDTGGAPAADETDATYEVQRKNVGRYLRFDPALWDTEEPAPDRLWAETTYIDNTGVIEDNFGVSVGLTPEELSERKTSSVTYRSAVEGLLYTWVNGPSLYNVRIGAQILLGLPVAIAPGVIVAINDVYSYKPDGDPEFGRLLVEDVDPRDGSRTGVVRIYLFPAEPTVGSDFLTGVAENPDTGVEYVVGDTVEKFAPLSKGVDVQDYVSDPSWWYGSYSQGDTATELQKFHKWRLRANAQIVSPEDFELAATYAQAIKPAWTDLDAVLTLYLVDEVTVEDDLYLTSRAYLFDDTGFSVEAVAMEDDWKGSLLRHLRDHTFGSRLYFDGHDLVMAAGSQQVSSARGGFLTYPAGGQAPNAKFPGLVSALGESMVREGDLLFVHEQGPNHGWYYIAGVLDDNTLVLDTVSAHVPWLSGPSVLHIDTASELRFVIARIAINPIVEGTGFTGDAVAGTIEINVPPAVQGVAVDDVFVVLNGGGRYTVTQVTPYSVGAPNTFRVNPTPPAGVQPDGWEIVRRYLDDIYEETDLQCAAGSNECTSAASLAAGLTDRLSYRRLGDAPLRARLTVLDGANAGEYDILDAAGASLFVHPPFAHNSGPNSFSVDFNHPYGGWVHDKLTLASPETTFQLSIYRPRDEIVAVADMMVLAPNYSEMTSATDLAAAGAQSLDFVEVRDDINPGIYRIGAVVGGVLDLAPVNLALMGPSNARILRDANAFDVTNDVVTVTLPVDLAVLGVLPGDLFDVFPGGAVPAQVAVIAELLTPTTFRVTRVLFVGTTHGIAGRILREEIG